MLTQTFHFAVLKEYQKIFGAQGKILVEVLQLRANNKFSFDIMPYIKRCALDIICGKIGTYIIFQKFFFQKLQWAVQFLVSEVQTTSM